MEFFDENSNPTGSDVEIGMEIAKRLGLQGQFVNSVFDTIIAAVKAGKCDIIISDQNITTDRQKSVSMIPYFQAGQSMVAAKGNPQQVVEADKVIDVGMRDKNVGDLQQVSRRLRGKVTKIQQKRTTLPSKSHKYSGVPEDPVEQP